MLYHVTMVNRTQNRPILFLWDVTKRTSDSWLPTRAGADDFNANRAHTIQGCRALCIDESMQAHQPRSTQWPSPSLLYYEEASAARNGVQERRGRRYTRSSVARNSGGSKTNVATSACWGSWSKAACSLRIALGLILAEGF
jgi:hypothetical protein